MKAVSIQLACRTYLLLLVPITGCLIDFVEFEVKTRKNIPFYVDVNVYWLFLGRSHEMPSFLANIYIRYDQGVFCGLETFSAHHCTFLLQCHQFWLLKMNTRFVTSLFIRPFRGYHCMAETFRPTSSCDINAEVPRPSVVSSINMKRNNGSLTSKA